MEKLKPTRFLWLLPLSYLGLAGILGFLAVKPALYGLSTILGTTILGTTVLGTTVLGTTVLGSTMLGTSGLADVYTGALTALQPMISLVLIGMLCYLELSDPSYGRTKNIVEELRRSWLPVTAFLTVIFTLIVAFRIWAIIA